MQITNKNYNLYNKNSNNKTNNKQNHLTKIPHDKVQFTAKPLYSANVKELIDIFSTTTKSAPAVIKRYSAKDPKDIAQMKKIGEMWKYTDYAETIATNFNAKAKAIEKLKKTLGGNPSKEELKQAIKASKKTEALQDTYFVLEKADEKLPLEERILAISEFNLHDERNNNQSYIYCLQAAPQMTFLKLIKGAGETILNGIVKYSAEKGNPKIKLESTAKSKGFYKHIGMTPLEKIVNQYYGLVGDKEQQAFIKKGYEKYAITNLEN